MSNSTPATNPLRISQLRLDGEGAWPDLQVEELSPQLNVFYGPPRAGKSSVAQLVGHLMYGATESPWRRQFGQTLSAAEGSVQLSSSEGDFVLRRHKDSQHRDSKHRDGNWQNRLTISSDNGDNIDEQTIQHLLSGLSPQLAANVFLVDFAESPRADWLLSETFAREFTSSQPAKTPSYSRSYSCCVPTESSIVDRVDRRRIDELVKRRDSIAGEIQQQMSLQRNESEVLEREIREVDSTLHDKRGRAEQQKVQLRRIDSELAELETRLRYFSLDHDSKHHRQHLHVEQHQQELAELDSEIARCRQTLASSQQRENLLRTELAQCSPDGTADSVTCLADGRRTLGVLEHLLDDLDAEVSQLARAHEPGRCIGHDSHAKLSPVAALLRQQVYTLCGQLAEQERIVRRQQLTAESRQLARVHTELGERLDLLLSRRESLIQRSQLASQPARLTPQPPAEHCRCEHHGEFVQSAEAMVLGRADRGQHESEARSQQGVLQRERAQQVDEFNTLQREIKQLEDRWEKLQSERAGLIGGASLESQQAELDRLESVLRQSLQAAKTTASSSSIGVWRASDILAQLTNGQLVQIRLERHQSQATIVDRHGQPRPLESLSAGQHDQLYLALTLALVSSYAQRNVRLPLILDEPFLKQDAAQAAAMVGVLEEFARAGHQLLVFTEDRDAQRRFSTLSAKLFDLEALRQSKPTRPATTTTTPELSPTVHTTNTRIIRETYDGHSTPVLRLAPVTHVGNNAGTNADNGTGSSGGDSQQDDLFYLTEKSSFNDFPVLGADTRTLFSQINIYAIGDLLAAEAEVVALQLDREGITVDTVQLWQIHMGLMCHVPNLSLDDAQVLAANGIDSPADLFDADINALLQSIEDFLNTGRGSHFERSRSRYSRSRLNNWQTSARHYRDRWQRSSRRYSGWKSRRSRRRNGSAQRTSQHQRSERQRTESQRPESQRPKKQRPDKKTRPSTQSQRKVKRPQRFYLSREQDVEDAPSIGPKTATRLAKVGIRTVADLLNADPESTATELDVSHVKAETLVAWQHQARLVCQIPRLRGYGAQLLVACGMTQPEQIARSGTNELVTQVLSFCETKEGQRILRSGDAPEREKIAEWIELASQSRSLEAA
ncbi:MAG: DUF4332 domain-containing protein [Planctomycetes bacterium]|nr:DUF4332 domain-containing protein [Planctomycetota bacterium]